MSTDVQTVLTIILIQNIAMPHNLLLQEIVVRLNSKIWFLAGAVALLPAQALAVKDVSSPYVDAGEIEIESKTGYDIDDDNDVDGTFEQAFEVGYGVTDWLGVEAGIEFKDEPGEDIETEKLELEATIQLTEKDEFFVDTGLKFGYGHSTNGGDDELETELLLAKSYGKFYHGANIEVGTAIGDDVDERGEWGLGWKSKYKYLETFSPGFEYHASFGDGTDDYEDQEHLLGPVAYGDINENFEYEAGVLLGISEAAPDANLKFILEYKF